MHPFTYHRPTDAQAALAIAGEPGSELLAGGTDMLQLLKDDVRRPTRLVDLTGLPGLSDITAENGTLRLGALARMSDVADHPAVRADFPVIAQALLASASPQVRHMATIGGNILQRTRCGYFRDVAMACNKRQPGSGCAALDGENRMHAILGGSDRCVATHASDLAVALAALDAVVVTIAPGGGRRIAFTDLHLMPGATPERETLLAPGELILAVEVPVSAAARRSRYRKLRDRASFEFALVSAAVALEVGGGMISEARIALGGVATKPWRVPEAEAALRGARPEPSAFEEAARLAVAGAQPLARNGFKVALARRNLVRALAEAAA
jgi:xanthine dehydrogenase YagS FAD-binding subunit